jgi:hypothetical protein
MAKKVMGPGPKKGITTLGAGTGTGITKYAAENARQKAIKDAARKSAAAAIRTPAPKKAAPKKPVAPAPAPKKAAAPAPAPAVAAKKPSTINKRAPLMDVPVGNKGYRMSVDTTNMGKPDESTYNFIIKNPAGKVTSKGNLSRGGGGAGIGKAAAKQLVQKLKAKK